MMYLLESNKKKYEEKIFFASLKSMKKEVGYGVGSGAGAGSGSAPKCHGPPTLLIIVKTGTRAKGKNGFKQGYLEHEKWEN
jgi:hypothetical protein